MTSNVQSIPAKQNVKDFFMKKSKNQKILTISFFFSVWGLLDLFEP